MTTPVGVVLGYASVSIIAGVGATATALAPASGRTALLLCAIAATIIALQSATRDPAALTWALLSSLPPVIALVAADAPTWLIGPLAALLLVAGELNALSWEVRGAAVVEAAARARLLHIGQLGALGAVAGLVVWAVALGPSFGGAVRLVVAGTALVALGWVIFRRGPRVDESSL